MYTELDANRRHEVLLGKAAELEKKHAETAKDRGSLAAENEALKVSVVSCCVIHPARHGQKC